jgi:hypothetical protein
VAGHHSAKLRRMESTGANMPSRAAPAPRPSFSTRLDLDFAFWAVVVHSLGSTLLFAVQRKMRGDRSGSQKGLQLLVELDSTWCETACRLISCTNAAGGKDLRHVTFSEPLHFYTPHIHRIAEFMERLLRTKLLIRKNQ